MNNQINLELKMIKDLHEEKEGLFFFNSKRLKEKTYNFGKNNYYGIGIGRYNISFSEKLQKYCQEGKKRLLFRIRKSFKNNYYEIINPIVKVNQLERNKNYIDNLDNRFWYVIKSRNSLNGQNDENYILEEYDVIKLGLTKYEVIKIKINKSDENFINLKDNNNNYNINEINKKAGPIFRIDIKREQFKIPKEFLKNQYLKSIEYSNENEVENDNINEDGLCWICFDSCLTSKENPKINLCKCRDRFVHYLCLKEYIKTKIVIHENCKHTVFTYICKKFNCDVCLTPYPTRFRIKELNKTYELIDLNIPEEFDYMILESLDYIKDKDNIKKIHVIHLLDENIYIGRNGKNDVIETNLTVSRNHAVLKYNKETGKVILENRSETYGTLVLVKGNIKIIDKQINLQIGNSLIVANLKKD